MSPHKRTERAARVKKLNAILKKLYPAAGMELNFATDFQCLVAVELSAQCTDKRVNMVTKDLFVQYPTIDAFAEAQQEDMEKAVFTCGFYCNKARNIIAAAKMVRDEFGGELPRSLAEMIKIPGAARKTANVVLSTLYGIHEGIAVDTHVRRFAIKFDLSDHTDPVRIEKDLMEIMPQSQWWGFNHRLVLYGRYVCKAHKHDCTEHPLTKVYPKAALRWPKSGS
jgi:endonuclease III